MISPDSSLIASPMSSLTPGGSSIALRVRESSDPSGTAGGGNPFSGAMGSRGPFRESSPFEEGALDPTPQGPLPHRRPGPVDSLYQFVEAQVAPGRGVEHHARAGRVGPE